MRYLHLGRGCGALELDFAITGQRQLSRKKRVFTLGTPGFGDRRSAPTPTVGKGEPRRGVALVLWYGGWGEPTRAAWVWSQTGRVAAWATVGQA